jgi:hypothetical protein
MLKGKKKKRRIPSSQRFYKKLSYKKYLKIKKGEGVLMA